MAVTITLTADASTAEATLRQFQATITQSLAGINAKMQDTAQKTQQTTEAWRTSLTNLSQATIKLVAPQQELSKAFLQTGQAAQRQLTEFEKLRQQYQKTQQATGSLVTSLGSVGGALRSMIGAFGVVLGAQGLASLVKSIVDAGLQMERFDRTLTAAVGSTKGAAEAWRFITAESNRLGQSVTEMVPIFVQLTAATRNTVLEGERTRELFSAMAGAGQAVGLSTDAVAGAMLGLTQIISQNAIQLDEFRNQFASRIPGAMLETAKALKTMGVTQTGTIAEMLKGFERGRISVTELATAVTMALKEIQRTAPDMSNSAEAAFTKLSNAVFQLKADLARSGLLEFMVQMADTARNLLARTREVIGLGGNDFLQQVGAIQGKLSELRKQRQDLLDAPLKSRSEDIRTGMVERLNQEIALQEQLLGKTQATHKAEKDAETEKARLSQERRDKEAADLKKVDAAAAAARQGAQDEAARARANVNLTQERVNQEKIAIDAIQALRTQALEQDYSTAVETTQQTKTAQADVETAFAIRRLDAARQAAMEDAKVQEQAAIQVRDAKIAAIKAADAAAAAAATDPKATAEAQVTANKRSAASTIELQTAKLTAENAMQQATKTRTDAEAAYVKGVTGVVQGESGKQTKITEAQLQREAALRQQALQGQSAILSAETELVQAQVEGLVLTKEEGLQRTQALETKGLENRRAQLEADFTEELRRLQSRFDAHEATEEDITAMKTRHAGDLRALDIQVEAQEQRHRNELLQGWREWVRDVQQTIGSFLVDVFEGQVRSVQSILDRLKSYFFKVIADMIAYAATNAIVVPIVSAVLGGLGGGGGTASTAVAGVGLLSRLLGGTGGTGTGTGGTGGGGLLETGGTALTGLGLAKSLYSMSGLDTLSGYVGTGLVTLKDTLLTGVDSIFSTTLAATNQAVAVNNALAADLAMGIDTAGLGASGTAGTTSQAAGALGGQIAGVAGGLAALGGGIYAALNASNNAARAAYAASAAAGAFAAATAGYAAVVGTAAAATAGTTGWTGIGLIVAAVMAVIGVVLDRVIKPEGPSLSVGRPSGLNITRQGDRLGVEGDLGTRVTRREGPSPEFANAVQAQMEEGITSAVQAMVQSINAIALDPVALLEPTQDALQAALRNLQTLNTANADKMTTDITEQLRFINIAIVGGLLEPVNKAFDQLRDRGTLTQQLERLPGTVSGMVSIFKNLNEQLDQINKGENTDVLRQVSAVRNQIENFGNRIAGTAGSIAESIVTGIMEVFKAQVDTTLAGQITQFAGMMNTSIRALGLLRQTRQTIEGAGLPGGMVASQIDRLVHEVGMTSARISTGIVTTALRGLSADLQTVLVQPLRVQATTVNSLFNDSLAALQALGTQWQSLSAVGIDTIWIQQQFTRLLGGLLDTVQQVLSEAFTGGDFGEFLAVLGSIPEAVTNLNPVWAQLRQLGVVFAQVVGPIVQVVGTLEDELRSTGERVTFTAERISELRGALVDAGDAADRALPLYAQLAQALQANAAALIQNIHEQAEAMRTTATAGIEGQRGRIETEVTRVEDFWQTWAEGERAALDARVQAEREALDARMDAEREALDVRMDAEREALSAGIDAHRKRIEDEVTRVTDFWNTWGDAQRAALDAWVESSTKMINTWAESTTTTANQLKRVNEAILAEQSPAKQRAALEAQKAGLINLINATGSQAAITELIDVDQQLLALAKQSNNLAGIQASIDELAAIQSSLTVSLASQTGQTDPFMATQVVQQVQADYLAAISAYQQTQTDRIQQTLDDNLGALQVVAQAQYDYLSTQEATALETITTNQEAQSDAITASQKMQSDAITANQEAQTARIEQTLHDNLSALQIVAQAQYDYLAVQQANALRDIAAWEEANVKAVKEDLITQLRVLEAALQNLFAGQQIVQSLLHSPIPVTIMGQSGVQAAGGVGVPAAGGQRGGIIGLASGSYYAQGGMVPGRFEPGERVYFPPIPAGVAALNRDVPRFSRGGGFTVPGSGVGDSFTALVPNGSFALNKRASGGMGFQSGGIIHGGSSTGAHSITVNIDMRGSQVRSESDYRRLTSEFRAAVTEALKEIERRSPKRGR